MSSSPNDPMAEIKASFFMECDELIEALQDGLQALEDGAGDGETVNVVFRAVHSIKGGAGAFGLQGLVRFAHRFETVLDAMRNGTCAVEQTTLRTLYIAADHLTDLVGFCRQNEPLPEAESESVGVQLDALLGFAFEPETDLAEIEFVPLTLSLDLPEAEEDVGNDPPLSSTFAIDPPVEAKTKIYTIFFKPFAELFDTGNDPYMLLRNLHGMGTASIICNASDIVDLASLAPEVPLLSWTVTLETDADIAEVQSVFEFVEGLCILQIEHDGIDLPTSDLPELPDAPAADPSPVMPAEPPDLANPPSATPSKQPSQTVKSVVRVDLDRIERLVNLVGELVINQAMLSQSLEHAGLSPHSDAMNGLEEFQRLTRDIQESVMMIRAQPVKSLFQRMSRIVREASAAVGKDVRLRTEGEYTEVDKTVIERLADPLTHMIRNAVDHGLETSEKRIAAGKPAQGIVTLTAAHRSGRVIIEVSDDGAGINRPRVTQIAIDKGLIPSDAQLTDTEVDNLLFLPGFSTASEVSDLSGRGVGMDVVRTEIQALGGRVSITSVPGKGTNFSMSLPLTLAVLDGMVIDVADQTLVLPLNQVVETLTLEAGQVQELAPTNFVLQVRDTFVSLIDLGQHLGYRPALDDMNEAIVLLVTHEDGNQAAFLIDNIVEQRQVVIKGLDDGFYRAPGVAAATIMGDGQIALILDPSDIITQALSKNAALHIAPPPLEGMHA